MITYTHHEWDQIHRVTPTVGGDVLTWETNLYNHGFAHRVGVRVLAANGSGDGPWSPTVYAQTNAANDAPVLRNAPDSGVIEIEVSESYAGHLQTVTATDNDPLTWSLATGASAPVEIDDNGNISIACDPRLDYGTTSSYSFNAVANDGNIGRMYQAVKVTVTEVSNPPATPSIPGGPLSFTVPANLVGGGAFGDPITGEGDALRYSLDATSDAIFNIECGGGQLSLDEGATLGSVGTTHDLTVTATDRNSNTATVDVTVTVEMSRPLSVPTNFMIEPREGGERIASWDPPAYNGGSPVTGYEQEHIYGSAPETAHIFPGDSPSVITSDGEIWVKIRARNTNGPGPWTASCTY